MQCSLCAAPTRGVNSSCVDATTMRCRRSSSKWAALHIGVTALFTFPPVHRVSSFANKISGEQARRPMKTIAIATAIALAVGGATGAYAQTYPSHPITIIVPFPAGGPTDTLARLLGERMRVSLGQPVIVETVTGAGASIGVARAAQAAPDGYTLSIGNWTSHVGAGAMYPAVHDAILEMEPVSRISATPLMIVGKNALPPKDAKELIAWLKANPGKASAAMFCAEASQTLSFVRGGKIKAYAVMSKERWPTLPDVPTMDEVGAPGMYISFWNGLWVPKGTPKDVIAKLDAAVVDTLADPAVRARLTELGHVIATREEQTPEGLAAFHKAEIDKWWPIIKAANIKPD